jgi:pimeloyl-ACP methyl ester carboxylesterase
MSARADYRRKLRNHLARILFSLQSFRSASFFTPAVKIPVPVFLDQAHPGERARDLVVLLPGKGSRGKDFRKKGFMASARAAGLEADLEAVDLHFGYYLKGIFLERLWKDVIEPAREQGYQEIHLVGISMGAAGALGLARSHPESVAGVVLIAPFLGPADLVETIQAEGGLEAWSPATPAGAGEFEAFFTANWEMMKSLASESATGPSLTLAFGEADRFARSQRLLASALPPGRVFTAPGGHRWGTWKALWSRLLQGDVFTGHQESPARVGATPLGNP